MARDCNGLSKAEFWSLGMGDVQNLLDEALEEIERLRALLPDVTIQGDLVGAQPGEDAESVAAVDAMDACVWALRLELPSAVHADVQERWERVRALLNDGDAT
jgi:hypothetical protein